MKNQDWSETLADAIDLGLNPEGNGLSGKLWKYEQLRAGQVYAKFMFSSREQAESFASHMTKAEPDLFCRIEPVEASAV